MHGERAIESAMNVRNARNVWGNGQTATERRNSAPADRAGTMLQRREAAIVVEDLRKSYGATVAVDGVSLQVDDGEVFGLLGPNGAGKTTTIEMIEGLRQPDAGRVRVCG